MATNYGRMGYSNTAVLFRATMSGTAVRVSLALNRFTNGVMVNALSDRNQLALTDLVEDFLCAPDVPDEDPGSSDY